MYNLKMEEYVDVIKDPFDFIDWKTYRYTEEIGSTHYELMDGMEFDGNDYRDCKVYVGTQIYRRKANKIFGKKANRGVKYVVYLWSDGRCDLFCS